MPLQSFSQNKQSSATFFIHNQGNSGGMFAEFASVLGALKLYEQGVYSGIEINFYDGLYLDFSYGLNWWEHYFEPIKVGCNIALMEYCSLDKYVELANIGFKLTRSDAFNLIQRYIHLRPEIEKEINLFVDDKFSNYFVVGMHFRGTDKYLEYPRTAYEKAFESLQQLIDSLSKSQLRRLRVYLATDEQQFLEYLQSKLGKRLIYNNFVRSTDKSTPLHYDNNFFSSNYQKGREALVDSILLSRCHVLLKPVGSCFSWGSSLFNPELSVVDYKW